VVNTLRPAPVGGKSVHNGVLPAPVGRTVHNGVLPAPVVMRDVHNGDNPPSCYGENLSGMSRKPATERGVVQGRVLSYIPVSLLVVKDDTLINTRFTVG